MEEWLDGPEAARLEHAALEEQLAARGREMLRLLLPRTGRPGRTTWIGQDGRRLRGDRGARDVHAHPG